eukprot:gene9664-25638_t
MGAEKGAEGDAAALLLEGRSEIGEGARDALLAAATAHDAELAAVRAQLADVRKEAESR